MELVLVLDCGAGDSQFLARKVRECSVYSEIVPGHTAWSELTARRPKGIIVCGGPETVDPQLLQSQIPVLFTESLRMEELRTSKGKRVIEDFVKNRCGCVGDWTMEGFIEKVTAEIRAQVGSSQVICGLSGGIDSSVAAVLVHKAIGDQLTCIYVDHGLMRLGETEQVINTFEKQFKMRLVHVDARKRFLTKLEQVEEPEEKRKIIGTEFIRVFEEEARKIGDAQFLVQGTLYPDVIESGVNQSGVIKSHHNVGGLPEDLQFSLIEPLKELFKDEVRKLAAILKLPDEIVWRHPFPGPGLAIRIMGAITQEKIDILQAADAIAIEEVRKAGLYRDIWQALVVLTNTRTVGVLDGKRTYDYVVALRFVSSEDGMSADWCRVPYDVLARISHRLMHEVKGINRVVYDISSKPPATIEWE